MTILAGNMIHWTVQTETNIIQGQKALEDLRVELDNALKEIVSEVRSEENEIIRTTYGSLIVIDVHNRDIVDNLARQDVQSLDDFEWLAQLRYYYHEKETTILGKTYLGSQLEIKCINSVKEYGYEYLGCSPRYLFELDL